SERRFGPKQAQQRPRLPIARIEARRPPEVPGGIVDAAESTGDLRGEPMALYVVRGDAENGLDLAQGGAGVLAAPERPRGKQAGRRVVRMPLKAIAADGDGLVHAPRLAIKVGKKGEAQRPRVLRDPLFVAPDGGGQGGLRRRYARAGRLTGHHDAPAID